MNLSMSSAFFAILFLIFEPRKCAQEMLWGCKYDNAKKFQQNIIEWMSPQYSENNITGASFRTQEYLNEVLGNINLFLKQVVSRQMFNTFDDIYRFYRPCLNRLVASPNDQYSAFVEYYLKYRPNEILPTGSYGLAISILKKIVKNYQILEENVYLATAYKGASEDFIGMQQHVNTIDTFKHNHMAAILKISFANQDSYLVMDPGSGFVKAVQVFDTCTVFSQEIIGDGYQFRMLPFVTMDENHVPIEHKSFMIQARKKVDADEYINILYYIEKPFCSVAGVTLKRSLLNPYRVMEKRNKAGQMVLRISTQLLPKIENPIYTIETPSYKSNRFFSRTRSYSELDAVQALLLPCISPRESQNIIEKIKEIGRIAREDTKVFFLEQYERFINATEISTSI